MTGQSTKPCLSAVFVDYDNIYLSLKRKNEEAAKRFAKDAGSWVQEISSGRLITPTNGSFGCENRRVVMNRCYGNPVPRRNSQDNSTDMNSFPFVRHHFLRSGFEIIDCPPLTAQLKNSSDIRMVMDVRDFLTHETYFDEFVILSGDADFTPLLHRLRAHARRTVIFANDYTAAPYTSICDGEIRESDLITLLLEGRLPGENEDGDALLIETDSRRNEAIRKEIIAEVVDGVRAAAAPVPLEALADRALRNLGHDKTAGSSWGGTGGFRELLTQDLPDDIALSDKAPYYAFDKKRHMAPKPIALPNNTQQPMEQIAPAPQAAPAQSAPVAASTSLALQTVPAAKALQTVAEPNPQQGAAQGEQNQPLRGQPVLDQELPASPAALRQATVGDVPLSVGEIATRPPQTAEQSYAAAANAHSQQQQPVQVANGQAAAATGLSSTAQLPTSLQPTLLQPTPLQATTLQTGQPSPPASTAQLVPQAAMQASVQVEQEQHAAPLQPAATAPAAPAATAQPQQAQAAPAASAASATQTQTGPAAPERQPDAASAMQQSIARIHDACQAPTLAPPEYRVMFEAMADEINENGLTGAQTLSNIAGRANGKGLDIQRDDVRFVLDVISEDDPWFEKGASANLFAGRFRNFVVARCRGQGLNLSAQELDLIEAWFAGSAPTVAAAIQTPGAPAAPATVADDAQASNASAYQEQTSDLLNETTETLPDEEFPRFVRSRLRG